MKFFTKLFIVLLFAGFISSTANAKTYYWTVTSKTLNGTYMEVAIVKTTTETPPHTNYLGKNVSVSAGPFNTIMDARTNCEKTLKLIKKNGQLTKNYCLKTVDGK